MAYCRFGDSDAYMFGSIFGSIECCNCNLSAKRFETIERLLGPRSLNELGMTIDRYKFDRKRWKSPKALTKKKNEMRKGKAIQKEDSWKDWAPDYRHPKLKTGFFQRKTLSFKTYSSALQHLLDHRKQGDRIPEYAIKRLRKEIKEHGDNY